MSSRLVEALNSDRIRAASREADNLAALSILGESATLNEPGQVTFSAHSIELVALRLAQSRSEDAQSACREAFELLRAVLQDDIHGDAIDEADESRLRTRAAAFGVLADLHAQTRQLLEEIKVPTVQADWATSVERAVLTSWQLIIRKQGWSDLDQIRSLIDDVRGQQSAAEPPFLEDQQDPRVAWRLVSAYHLLRAAEIITEYTETGASAGHFDPVEQAELHFDRARDAAIEAADPDLAFLTSLLDLAARTLIQKSIWRIARGAGTRAAAFVRRLASRENDDPFLELLPPQRKALIDDGLIGTGRRSVVVSLPTSAGKTLVAEFRILQALDSYEAQGGWVAYTAPNRALVNQLTARLRRDFAPLGIRVERFSAALEVDSVEAEILESATDRFRVVVTTPEKLDLLLRGGWMSDLGRPLSLVIVDEAHNLGAGSRGLKLELLLATINREAREASFLLMTPFIPNAAEIAAWLDPINNQAVELGLEWLPNDRVVGLARLEKEAPRGNSKLLAEPVLTSAPSLHADHAVELAHGRPLGLTFSKLNTPTALATAAADALSARGSTVTLVQRPGLSWGVAERLASSSQGEVQDELIDAVSQLLGAEYGHDYPLANLLRHGVAVHHAGLSDDIRLMVEALAERGVLRHIVATTTLAQGINFPISNVVLASYQYPYGVTMPPEDFWNIAGRAGRANHGQPGVILLASHSSERESALREYLSSVAQDLTSTLVAMVETALDRFGELDLARLTFIGEWSSFVQFITHTYRIAGAEEFAVQVEQVLRGTLGFRELRSEHPEWADLLVQGVQRYTSALSGKPISLVDSTGFSWESVSATLARISEAGVGEELMSRDLFTEGSAALSDAIGVLLRVPELREQLVERLDPAESEGDFLSKVVKDWVAGMSLSDLAESHFSQAPDGRARNHTESLTRCCQKLFGSILPTVSWGLSALQALTMAGRSDDPIREGSRDVPSYVFYGVDTREAVALRLFGVPRAAAIALARNYGAGRQTDELRQLLANSTAEDWTSAIGEVGKAYFTAWRLIEPAA